MTRYRIRRILSDPVYIGKPKHMGQTVIDPSLQFSDEESFSKAQMQLKSIITRHMKKGEGINELVEKYGISVFAFLDQVELTHSNCGGKLVRNGTRIIDSIKRYTYLCKRCRDQFWIPTKKQLNRLINGTKKIKRLKKTTKTVKKNISKETTNQTLNSENNRKLKRLNSYKLYDFFHYSKE